MTAGEVISAVDALEPNSFTQAQKLAMLNGLEGRIFTEVILTHDHNEECEFTPVASAQSELIVAGPFAEPVYGRYLQAMIALQNAEIARYNQQISMFNDAFRAWSAAHHRITAPLGPKENRLKF